MRSIAANNQEKSWAGLAFLAEEGGGLLAA
jgi:hypothetical protein